MQVMTFKDYEADGLGVALFLYRLRDTKRPGAPLLLSAPPSAATDIVRHST